MWYYTYLQNHCTERPQSSYSGAPHWRPGLLLCICHLWKKLFMVTHAQTWSCAGLCASIDTYIVARPCPPVPLHRIWLTAANGSCCCLSPCEGRKRSAAALRHSTESRLGSGKSLGEGDLNINFFYFNAEIILR